MYNQMDAENVIDFLFALVQIETLPSIKLGTWYAAGQDFKTIRGRKYLVSDHINWDFIKRRHFGERKIDHIEKVSVRRIIRYSLEEYYSDIEVLFEVLFEYFKVSKLVVVLFENMVHIDMEIDNE